MCFDPATAALITSVVSSAASYAAQAQQANAQDATYKQNVRNSRQALAQQYTDTAIRQREEMAAAAAKREEITQNQRAAIGSARVSAGEAGVSGLSFAGLVQDIEARGGANRARVNQNLNMTLGQLERGKTTARTQADSQSNSVSRGSHPNPLGLALGIGDAAIDYRSDTDRWPLIPWRGEGNDGSSNES